MSINLFDGFDPFNSISGSNTQPFYIDFVYKPGPLL